MGMKRLSISSEPASLPIHMDGTEVKNKQTRKQWKVPHLDSSEKNILRVTVSALFFLQCHGPSQGYVRQIAWHDLIQGRKSGNLLNLLMASPSKSQIASKPMVCLRSEAVIELVSK